MADAGLVRQLDLFRKKRNLGGYERAGTVSYQEASKMIALADRIRQEVGNWLKSQRSDLLHE